MFLVINGSYIREHFKKSINDDIRALNHILCASERGSIGRPVDTVQSVITTREASPSRQKRVKMQIFIFIPSTFIERCCDRSEPETHNFSHLILLLLLPFHARQIFMLPFLLEIHHQDHLIGAAFDDVANDQGKNAIYIFLMEFLMLQTHSNNKF